jgi:hypothetical protein
MSEKTSYQIPDALAAALATTRRIVHEYLSAIRFIVGNSARDPAFTSTHLLSYLSLDFIESAGSIAFLAQSGSLSVPKRDLRFIIESSIKLCYVQQKNYRATTDHKLKQFDKELSSPSISIKRDLNLWMIPEPLRSDFDEELGRLYGKTSTFVHLTPTQISQRIAAVDAGRMIGFESPSEVEELNSLISRGFAASLVLLFHGVGDYVAGDFLVDSDGSTMGSYFLGSRFIAGMDEYFDYKAERKARLSEVQAARAANICF